MTVYLFTSKQNNSIIIKPHPGGSLVANNIKDMKMLIYFLELPKLISVMTMLSIRTMASISDRNNAFTIPKAGDSITSFLNPRLFESPDTIIDIKAKLRAGRPVVINNAFIPEYAEAMYQELSHAEDAFEPFVYSHEGDDFSCDHYNIYDLQKYTPLMNATLDLFNSAATKEFASELSGRRCGGESWPSASWYKPGSHSLPHTDWDGQRTVAYVWHLTKEWKHVRSV